MTWMTWRTLAAGLVVVGASACGSEDGANTDSNDQDSMSSEPGLVGSSCETDAECGGYDNAVCNQELRPVEDFVEDTGDPANTALRELTLPFPGGYCSTPLETDCAADSECGEGGGCFMPFEGVSEEVIAGLDATIPQLDVPLFSERGLCLQRCASEADCRTEEGYHCIVPLADFMTLINEAYDKTFCMQEVDVSYLLMPGE